MVTLDTQYCLALNETRDSNLLNILTRTYCAHILFLNKLLNGLTSNFLFIIKFSNSYF